MATSISPILNYDPGVGIPGGGGGGTIVIGHFYYWPSVTSLTGGMSNDLDGQSIAFLPDDALIEVIISGRGASQWSKTNDNTSPVTNTDAGVIVPVDYDPVTNPWVLLRQLGF